MIEHPLLLFIFVLVNLAITLGYLYLAVRIVPKVRLQLKRTIYGGIGFFVLCAITHLDLAASTLFAPDMTFGEMAGSWPMLLVHAAQAVAVWLFVTGLYVEVGDWGQPERPALDADAEQH